jgi:spoIIIJ-associated protein
VETPQSIEAIGTTVEEAIGRGLEALNVAQKDVDVMILSAEPGRTARVRLTRKPREAAAAADAPVVQSVTPDESAAAQRLVEAVLDRMKYKVQIIQRDPAELNGYDEQDEPTLVLDIRGGDLSTLIGRRGETLDGLQYLVRLLVAKELGHYVHVVLDVEGYKAHRAQTLKQLALRMAERVVATHKPAALEPMPANERRIVHLALRDNTQVRTESVGMGENRKVTIIPQSYKR